MCKEELTNLPPCIPNRGRLTELYISPEAMEDIRKWALSYEEDDSLTIERKEVQMRDIIRKDNVKDFTYTEYRKVGTTKLSNEVLPAGQKVETLEGEYTCAEPSRLAIDVAGNVYPVAESVFVKCYERVLKHAVH